MPTATLMNRFVVALLRPLEVAKTATDRLRNLVAENARPLSPPERSIARSVYVGTIPYDRVVVTRLALPGGRPCTTPVQTPTGLVYALNVGTIKYPSLIGSPSDKALLVHELAHVWQSVHSGVPYGYVVESVLATRIAWLTTSNENNAYKYKAGATWASYNVEQQAQLVQDWYAQGMKEDGGNALYPYIRDTIRRR
jgi:hypothetical protein